MSPAALRLLSAAVAALAMLLASAVAAAAPRVYVVKNCQDAGYKPSAILLACGDANAYFRALQWSKWTAYKAVGQGRFRYNTCDPTCAEGTFRSRSVRVKLYRPRYCSDLAAKVFTRIRYSGEDRAGRLFCPIG